VDAVPVIARGHNAAVLLPPAGGALAPLLAAIPHGPILVLASDRDAALEWAVAAGEGALVLTPGAASVAAERLAVCGAADALELMKRSLLRPADYAALVLAWPEETAAEEMAALEAVMAEARGEAQRVIVTAVSGAPTSGLLERYAFKAMTFGFPPSDAPAAAPVGAASYVIAPPSKSREWTLLVRGALGNPVPERPIVPCPWSRDAAAVLVSGGGGSPVLVLTPGQLRFARGLFQPLTPLVLPGLGAALERRTERLREELAGAAESGDLDRELLLLAPLLDRFDPVLLAAAAVKLARPGAAARATAAEPAGAAGGVPSWSRIWVGIGRKDNVRPGDLVGALVNEVGLAADAVGRIEVRDLFCLVEVRPDVAERVVKGLTGTSLRGRRLTARVDRGPGGPGGPRAPRRA
jgi:hypothetical protein